MPKNVISKTKYPAGIHATILQYIIAFDLQTHSF